MTNPYQAPYLMEDAGLPPQDGPNRWARIGLGLNLLALVSLVLVDWPPLSGVGCCGAFLALPGLVCSVLGLTHPPRWMAILAILVGTFVGLYLPTILLLAFW